MMIKMNGASSVDAPPTTCRPRDGPATTFEVDPFMTEILASKSNNYDEHYFGLVLVVGWPPQEEMKRPYQALVQAMRSFFDKEDHEHAYFCPLSSLHVTAATFACLLHPNSRLGQARCARTRMAQGGSCCIDKTRMAQATNTETNSEFFSEWISCGHSIMEKKLQENCTE